MHALRSTVFLAVLSSILVSSGCAQDSGDDDTDTGTSLSEASVGESGASDTTATNTAFTDTSDSETTATDTSDTADTADTTDTSATDTSDTSASGDGDGDMEPNWSMTHIDYSGPGVSESVDHSDCQFCDVNDVGTHILLRFQQDGGWTIWALYLPTNSTTGAQPLTQDYTGAYATLSANQSSLPAAAQGMYFGDTNVGSVTLTSFDTSSGGLIAGSIDVMMTKGEVTAQLSATFESEMP